MQWFWHGKCRGSRKGNSDGRGVKGSHRLASLSVGKPERVWWV